MLFILIFSIIEMIKIRFNTKISHISSSDFHLIIPGSFYYDMLMLCLLYEQTKEEEEEKYFSTLHVRLETQRSNRMKKKDCHVFFFFFSFFFLVSSFPLQMYMRAFNKLHLFLFFIGK